MKILAIESSCDETAAAVVEDGTKIFSNIIASSHEMHEKYGGIVPEVAARQQLEYIIPTLNEALVKAKTTIHDVDAIAVTIGPGLIGSLLVGVETAKTIAATTGKPIIPVNHVLAHMYANFVQHTPVIASDNEAIPSGSQPAQAGPHSARDDNPIEFPAISLVVSGGHTELYLMESEKKLKWLGGTLDDAAGEAFDKSARLMGFGNEGGPAIQREANKFIVRSSQFTVKLPRPMLDKDNELNFSFSGLKTAIWREWSKCHPESVEGSAQVVDSDSEANMTSMFAYEVQESITDVLVKKTLRAVEKYDAKAILLSGGVSANLRLREKFLSTLATRHPTISFHVPPVSLCTDNAVYIASYAFFRGKPQPWDTITAAPDLSVEEI